MDDLTFVHTSFEKIFCQNKIKKNCKLIMQFSVKTTDKGRGKRRREKG